MLKLLVIIFLLKVVSSYPLARADHHGGNRKETKYPNGTIIGKYTLKDEDGNPVHVKYFADESSYGVELNSVKVSKFDQKENENINKPILEDPFSFTSSPDGPLSNLIRPFKVNNSTYENQERDKPLESKKSQPDTDANKYIINKGVEKLGHQFDKEYRRNPDYEVFVENDLKTPEKCGKSKVQVYLDREKRRTKNYMPIDRYSDPEISFCMQ